MDHRARRGGGLSTPDSGRHVRKLILPLLFLVFGPSLSDFAPLSAQEADPDDVSTIDAIITALYASISGPVGVERDFDRFKSLFAQDGKLIPTGPAGPDSPAGYAYLTPEDYWERSSETLARIGFTEAEIGRTTESFGRITHVFSTYESYRLDQGDPDVPFARGINSIQLVEAGGRFWILTVFWDSERPDNPIPDRYIGTGSD